ncbi:DUF4974 domain-containing protein [Chitinophaga sp. SYP-B3965]|uniref:FecR family protein n=1 Tax=Chitinophaga sp. SYP-B3965 TaxID=2663120 RepID=UPI0012999FFC|nr:FecR family protein [Chitinophaga sp. SYP-B3965]MRG45171.1 DUF4974 domain-containing protein [Chitinophaga sp. SYP-B3965]
MEQLQSLIEKYWAGTATSEEKQRLLFLLATDEAGLKEWLERNYENDLEEAVTPLSGERSLELWQRISLKKTPVRRMGWVRQAAAVVLLAGAGLLAITLFRNNRHDNRPFAEKAALQLKQVTNTDNVAKVIMLPDSSVVSLEANSIIAYYEPFNDTQRNISLTGKALFKVVADPDKPFSVYANGIATIALGTEFTVSATPQKVDVRLYKGKVVVRSGDKDFVMKEVYLAPGEGVNIDITEKKSTIIDIASGKEIGAGKKKENERTQGLVFRQTPLQQVFDRLSIRYKVKIESNATDMKGLMFTGTFAETDSLQNILSVIASLNNLSIQQQEEKIIIKK